MRPENAHLNKLPRDSDYTWRSKGRISGAVCMFVWLLQKRSHSLLLHWKIISEQEKAFTWAKTGKDSYYKNVKIWEANVSTFPREGSSTREVQVRRGQREHLATWSSTTKARLWTKQVLSYWGRVVDKREWHQGRESVSILYLNFHFNCYSYRYTNILKNFVTGATDVLTF